MVVSYYLEGATRRDLARDAGTIQDDQNKDMDLSKYLAALQGVRNISIIENDELPELKNGVMNL